MNCAPSRMTRSALTVLVCLASVGFTKQALASGDGGCSASWKLVHHAYGGCSNMGFLSPSNDTRVNLLLLMNDLRSVRAGTAQKANTTSHTDAPLFLWEQLANRLGTPADRAMLLGRDAEERKDSEPSSSLNDGFIKAVQVDRALRPDERDALVIARRAGHSGAAIAGAEKVAKTAAARAYVLYLQGAATFWQADYEKAAVSFTLLTNAEPTWVRETAAYMAGRTLIKRGQVGAFDEYGSFTQNWHADGRTISEAETALDKYLQQYPRGPMCSRHVV